MAQYFITFGSQYTKDNPHPILGLTKDDYMFVSAPTEAMARAMVAGLTEDQWSMIYTVEEWNLLVEKYYLGKPPAFSLTLTPMDPMLEAVWQRLVGNVQAKLHEQDEGENKS